MVGRKQKRKLAVTPAKISAPHLESYRRGRLFQILDRARRKRVAFITAPAGAGKTSLVTSYLEARRLPALWYNVDRRDADVANLFEYLSAAARAQDRRKKLHLPAFRAENEPGAGAFARTFFEELCQARPVPSVIVFDDYHEARSQGWDDVFREALRAVPRGIAVFIISRAGPPPFLVRHVAAGEMAVLGWSDLRLTTAEIVGLIRLHRPDLRGARLNAQLPRILELANGWAAALTLLLHDRAALNRDAHGIEEFSQRLFDYFATEIFSHASANQRDFLLRTSVASSLTAQLAARLMNSADAEARLADLERNSFLIQRLGTSGTYRYHPLLRGFLRGRAEIELGRQEVQELHRRAAKALVEAGDIEEAMEQFETANDVSARRELLLRVAPAYVGSGRRRTVAGWIDRLSREAVENDGWLLYWDALCCFGDAPSRAREQLEKAYACFSHQANAEGLYCSCAAAIQAIVHEGCDYRRLEAWTERVESLQTAGPACPESLLPMVATGMLAASLFHRADAVKNRHWAERAMTFAAASNDMSYRFMTGGALAMYFVFHDDPARAEVILEMVRTSTRAIESSALATLTQAEVESMCRWIRGDNGACLKLVREALTIAARTGLFVWNDFLNNIGATTALAAEDFDAAQEFLDALVESAQRGAAFAAGSYHFYISWLAMLRGDAVHAHHSIRLACDIADALGYTFAQSLNAFATAQIEWHLGYRREANESLALARQRARQTDCALVLHACDLIESDFAWEQDREHALACMRRGLALARERGYFNMLWMRRVTMAKVAVRALEHGVETEHVRAYIMKHRLVPEHVPHRIETWPWRYRLRALGSFEVTREDPDTLSNRDDEIRPSLRGVPLRLLQTILTLGARGVRDAELIDAIWPDAEGDSGRRVFDTTMHRLRRQLGDDQVLRLRDGRVSLDTRLCWIDIWALDDLILEVERELKSGAGRCILENLAQRLLGVYRGPLLGGDAQADWAHAARERIAKRFSRAAEALGRALENEGLSVNAAALYRRALEGNPLAEPVCAGLMRCAVAIGRAADAALTFEEYRNQLAISTDAKPGAEIASLYAQLAQRPAGRARPS
jgi:LuxR family transcriptional regulator, maltose regulon positive regulatory protein